MTVVKVTPSVRPDTGPNGWGYDWHTPFWSKIKTEPFTAPSIEHYTAFASDYNVRMYHNNLKYLNRIGNVEEYLSYLTDKRMSVRVPLRNDCYLYLRCDGRDELDEEYFKWRFQMFTSFGYYWYGYCLSYPTTIEEQTEFMVKHVDSYCDKEIESDETTIQTQ